MGVEISANLVLLFALENFLSQINSFRPISLANLDKVKLLNRVDTKFVFHQAKLPLILEAMSSSYRSLDIDENRIFSYKSHYLDGDNYPFYLAHHNGKMNRVKVRFRNYADTGSTYLEVKFKSNKGRTIKQRMPSGEFSYPLSEDALLFLSEVSGIKILLSPALLNSFKRITLVDDAEMERVTFDVGLQYSMNGSVVSLDGIVVAEVKQDTLNRQSSVMRKLKDLCIYPSSFSKYCMGMALLNPGIKHNRFRPGILALQKLTQIHSY